MYKKNHVNKMNNISYIGYIKEFLYVTLALVEKFTTQRFYAQLISVNGNNYSWL